MLRYPHVMTSGSNIYHPTVWRTCRALMNARRLACLSAVLNEPGRSVGEVAAEAGIPRNQASINLRALQARGLLVARRDRRWICYFPQPDPLVKHAATVLDAVRRELKSGGGCQPERLLRTLRAFSHSRRLKILNWLSWQDGATCEELVSAARISQPAVSRHLETLSGSGLVSVTEDGEWKVLPRRDLPGLAKALLDVIAS